jgi:hypothetical protein
MDNDTNPNVANGYTIEESTDGTTFTPVGTAAAGATTFVVSGLQVSTTYSFRVAAFNGHGASGYSNVVVTSTAGQSDTVDFSQGFASPAGALTANGSATFPSGVARLTDGEVGEAGSVFTTNPVDVAHFSTQFAFQLLPGSNTADGFTFTIQGNGPTALGGTGGALGYAGMGNSVAVKFDLYDNFGEGPDSTGLYTGGAAPANVGSIDLTPSGIDLHSGDVFDVAMSYDGTTLAVTITDAYTWATATQSYQVDIPQLVGGNRAYVGFTGGTGALIAVQDLFRWFYTDVSGPPAAPSDLTGIATSPTEIDLTWANNATNQAGFVVDRSTDGVNFTQLASVGAQDLHYRDTSVSPGTTWYYEVQATNAAGSSPFSSTFQVTPPSAPAAPSDLQATQIDTTSVDLAWTDHATNAAGYHVSEQLTSNSPRLIATLPASATSYHVPNLIPGAPYHFLVSAFNSVGVSDGVDMALTTLPAAPTGVTATSGAQVMVTWNPDPGAVTYNVYRSTSPTGGGDLSETTGVTGTTFTDADVSAGTTYYYTVTAVNPSSSSPANDAGESAPSATVSATAFFPSLVLSYGGPGTNLSLTENGSPATPNVTISESGPNLLKIDLGGGYSFDPSSALTAAGLSYEHSGSPGTSHYATIDISAANAIGLLQATLPGDLVSLGPIADANGGLGNFAVSAGSIVLGSVDLTRDGPGSGNVDLRATGDLHVSSSAAVLTAGTLALAADVNADGTGDDGVGTLQIDAGALVRAANVTLRGAAVHIDTGTTPATVTATGAAIQPFVANVVNVTGLAFDGQGTLYAGSGGYDHVTKIDLQGSPPGQVSTVGTLFNVPIALAYDTLTNHLWVANLGDNTVAEVDPATGQILGQPISGFDLPDAVVFDRQRNLLWVANRGDGVVDAVDLITNTIDTSRSLSGMFYDPEALALDQNDNLLVADDTFNAVFRVDLTASHPTPTQYASGFNEIEDMGYDPTSQTLYVGNYNSSAVSVVAPDGHVSATLTDGISFPRGLALDSAGNLYVANFGDYTVRQIPAATLAWHPPRTGGNVTILTSQPTLAMSLGDGGAPVVGVNLSNAELGRIQTTGDGSITFGDSSQAGDVSFPGARPVTTAGASLVVNTQGHIILDDEGNTPAIDGNGGNVLLNAGAGIVGDPTIATSGNVTLTSAGGLGTPAAPLQVNAAKLSASAGGGVYLCTTVSDLAVSAGAGVTVANSGALTLDAVGGLAGVSASSGDIDVSTTGALFVNAAVHATLGNVTLTGTPVIVGTGVGVTADSGQVTIHSIPAATSLAVGTSNPAPVYGESVVFTASVTDTASSLAPAGSVEFFDGSTDLGPGTFVSSSGTVRTWTLTTANLSGGPHSVTATFTGDASGDFVASNNDTAPCMLTVSPAADSVTVTPSNTTSIYGQSVTFTAAVAQTSPTAQGPTGQVQFLDNGVVVDTETLSGGQATYPSAGLLPGSHSLTVHYLGDGNFASGDSSAVTATVAQRPVQVAVAAASTSIQQGQSVVVTVTVTDSGPGTPFTPTGTVTLSSSTGSDVLVPLAGGALTAGAAGVSTAQFTLSAVDVGGRTLTASYAGSTIFLGNVGSGSLSVLDVPPTVRLGGDTIGVRGQPRTVLLNAQDLSPGETAVGFTYTVNWGDGTPSQALAGPAAFSAAHAYALAGTYTVAVTATDEFGSVSTTATQPMKILAVTMEGNNLAVGSTAGNDSFTLSPGTLSGQVSVRLNGASLGTFAPTGSILLFGDGGADRVVVNGGAGNDTFTFAGNTVGWNGQTVLGNGISSWQLNGGGGGNTFTVSGGAATRSVRSPSAASRT